jgi:hypothetical protein
MAPVERKERASQAACARRESKAADDACGDASGTRGMRAADALAKPPLEQLPPPRLQSHHAILLFAKSYYLYASRCVDWDLFASPDTGVMLLALSALRYLDGVFHRDRSRCLLESDACSWLYLDVADILSTISTRCVSSSHMSGSQQSCVEGRDTQRCSSQCRFTAYGRHTHIVVDRHICGLMMHVSQSYMRSPTPDRGARWRIHTGLAKPECRTFAVCAVPTACMVGRGCPILYEADNLLSSMG